MLPGASNGNTLVSSLRLCQSFSSEDLHSGCLLCPEFWEDAGKMNPVFLRTSLGEKKNDVLPIFSTSDLSLNNVVSHALEKGTKFCFALICIRDMLFVVPSENLSQSGELISL